MTNLSLKQSEQWVCNGLLLFYILFFINFITDSRSSWSLSYILILLALIAFISSRDILFNGYITWICLSSFFTVTCFEYFFYPHYDITDPFFKHVSEEYIQQFIYVILLALLPFLYKFSHFKQRYFEYLIAGSIVFSLVYNTYLNINLEFSRELLVAHFKSVILYDYCITALSLLGIVLSFQYRHRASYMFIALCLLNLTMIILHGSRGAWVGLPLALVLICLYFFKSNRLKSIFVLLSSTAICCVLTLLPNSPIEQRIQHLKNDAELIESKQNYNSSVGTRLALWHFSLEKFQISPWNGHGFIGFRDQICDPQNIKKVPNCQPHAHNIVLQELAAHGVFGLLNLMIIYVMPFFIFLRQLWIRSSSSSRIIAFSGVIYLLYIGISSMSDFLFFFEFPTMFYFLILITLLTLSIQRNTDKSLFSST